MTPAAAGEPAADRAQRPGREFLLPLLALTVVGTVLRLRELGQPMRYDEAYSYLFFVQVPLLQTLSDYPLPNQHILNSLLMRASVSLFGTEPWALRLPAFLFGVATIPVAFWALRRWFGAASALLAAACVTASAPLIVYSTNARGYSLVGLLYLAMLGVSAGVRDGTARRPWPWLVVLAVLGLYAIPTMLYAAGGVFLWLGLRAWRLERSGTERGAMRRVVVSAFAVMLGTIVVYLPVLFARGIGPVVANDWVTARTPAVFFHELPTAGRALWQTWHAGVPWPLSAALLAGIAAWLLRRDARRGNAGMVACAVAWCLILLVLTMRPPFARVWLFLLPVHFAVACAGVVSLLRARTPPRLHAVAVASTAAALLIGMSAGVLRPGMVHGMEGPVFPDAEKVVAWLDRQVRPGDGVYARTPSDMPVWYYTWRAGISDAPLRLKYRAPKRVFIVVNDASGPALSEVLRETPLGRGEFTEPLLRTVIGQARVYEVSRR